MYAVLLRRVVYMRQQATSTSLLSSSTSFGPQHPAWHVPCWALGRAAPKSSRPVAASSNRPSQPGSSRIRQLAVNVAGATFGGASSPLGRKHPLSRLRQGSPAPNKTASTGSSARSSGSSSGGSSSSTSSTSSCNISEQGRDHAPAVRMSSAAVAEGLPSLSDPATGQQGHHVAEQQQPLGTASQAAVPTPQQQQPQQQKSALGRTRGPPGVPRGARRTPQRPAPQHHHKQQQQQPPGLQAGSLALQQPATSAAQQLSGPLSVTMSGALHKITFQADDCNYKVLAFKEVHKCSNGSVGKDGWHPQDIGAALSISNRSSSACSSSSSTSRHSTSSKNYAKLTAQKWLKVTGNFGNMQEGMMYKITGQWTNHATHGWQISATSYEASLGETDPVTCLMRLEGVGEATARAIISVLGSDMDSITSILSGPAEQAMAALQRVPKIGPTKARALKHAWDAMGVSVDQQTQLQDKLPHLSPRLVGRILQYYDNDTDVEQRMASNPYALLRIVPGYTLQDADRTATALGFSPAAPERGAAYVQHVLLDALSQSHSCLRWSDLQKQALRALAAASWKGWPPQQGLQAAAEVLVVDGRVVVEEQRPWKPPQQQQQQQQQQQHGHKQQELLEFEIVQSNWSDSAVLYLRELHQAEQDTVQYFLEVTRLSCSVLGQLQQPQQPQQPLGAGAQDWRTHKSRSARSSSSVLQLPVAVSDDDAEFIDRLEREMSEQLGKPVAFNEGQRAALVLSQELPVMALTGGPGCGKTLVSQAIARQWLGTLWNPELFMAAPTGRAAQRLQELLSGEYAEDVSASTIHRLLGYRNGAVAKRLAGAAAGEAAGSSAVLDRDFDAGDLDLGSKCEHNVDNPLPEGKYLVDEVSMMDMGLAAALFNALRGREDNVRRASLTLVGDPDQLPPVRPGQPVADALAEGMLPCIDLRQIYRTAANSAIVTSAHAINRGEQPQFSAVWDIRPGSIASDISQHVSRAAAEPNGLAMTGQVLLLRLPDSCSGVDVAQALQQAAKHLVPRLDCDMKFDVQVLTPVKSYAMGVTELNHTLQELFNPPDKNKVQLSRSGKPSWVWRVGDRVTHLKNDTHLDVYNGDQGYIETISKGYESLVVRYPPRAKRSDGSNSQDSDDEDIDAGSRKLFHRVTYSSSEAADTLQLAWATTVHKAQGGEFPVVLLAMHKCAGRLLRRQLLYTAASRAQKLLVMVGTQAAIDECLRHTGSTSTESSRFRAKLRSARVKAGLPTIQRAVYGPEGWSA